MRCELSHAAWRKKNRNSSVLMSSQDITLLLYPVISSSGELVPASFKHVYTIFLNKNRWRNKLNSPKEELTLTILCRIGVMVQICFCLKKVYLSLLENFLSILIQIFQFPWLVHWNFQKIGNSYKVTNDP